MTAAYKLDSNFEFYQASTGAILKKFEDGAMYLQDPKQYFGMISSVCDYFKTHIINVQKFLNDATIETYNYEDNKEFGEGIEFINHAFDSLDDYIESICADFAHFQKTVVGVISKDKLEYRCRIDFNLVENRISDLNKDAERVRGQLLAHFFSKLSDEEKAQRSM